MYHVVGREYCIASHEAVGACFVESSGVFEVYATIHLDEGIATFAVNYSTEATDFVVSVFDEFLSAKAWVYAHKEYHIYVGNDVFEEFDRSVRVERYASFHTSVVDALDSAVEMSASMCQRLTLYVS